MLQEHGDTIIEASRDASYVPTVASDGIITSEPNTLLCVVLADCAAILAVDPKTRILGAAHSGWRGTKQNIAGKLIAAMTARGAQASRIRTYISPVACPKHYQVGPEFARYFAATYIQQLHGTACFDNSLAISHQLANAGVGDCTIDTRCTVEDLTLHSHRRDGQQAGRYVAYIGALTET